MTRFYLMRHGQTLFNTLNRIQGWCDSPLTEKGQGWGITGTGGNQRIL